jgi:hypothetical protein
MNAHILPDLAQAQARIAELEAKLAAANKPRKATLKVTAKGGLSLYGLGKFPVTLYRGQWERLLSMSEDIRSFIEANASSLSTKE